MATTTNYGWTTPDDTALVKDGASAIRSLGTAVDTTTKNLNPSTTLGDIEYRSSTANTNTRLGIGSTGQILTVAGGVPSWATPAGGGGYTSLASGSLPSADNLELTSISADYKDLRLVLRNCQQASDNEILFRFNANASSIYGGLSQYGVDTTYSTGASALGNRIYGTNDMQEASTTSTFQLDMYDYANTTAHKLVRMQSQFVKLNTTDIAQFHIVGNFRSTSAISSIKVFANGIFNAGTYELFGIK